MAQIGNEGDDPDTVPSEVTIAELETISPVITGLEIDNEEPYQEYIDANPELFSSPALQEEVQDMVDAVNASESILEQIGEEGDDPDTVPSVVTVAELETISPEITGLEIDNEEPYQEYIDANPELFSSPATLEEVQNMVDAVNVSEAVLTQIGNEGDDPDTVPSVITTQQIGTISPAVTGIVPGNEEPYQEYIDTNPESFSSPATQEEIQDMVTTVNVSEGVLTQIGNEGDEPDVVQSVVTVAELGTISPEVTGLVISNESLYQEYIDENPSLISAPATAEEVQSLVTAVNTSADGTNVNTTITATSPIVADGVTVTNVLIRLANTLGEFLTEGGDNVTLSITGNATQEGTLVDFGNGTYVAEYKNLVGEFVTITGTVNGKPITSSAIVEFLADLDNDSNPDITDLDDDGDGQSDEDEIACGSDPLDLTSVSDDLDNDNLPDCVDPDDDNDGILDDDDENDDNDGQSDEDEIACGSNPLDPASVSLDSDGDTIPDCTDEDDDGDGQTDDDEIACGSDPLDGASISADNDLDGIPNCVDPDDDNDGILDTDDEDDDGDGINDEDEVTCGSNPQDSTDAALDTDGDGIPNCIDEDDDNDGTPDEEDAFPMDETEDTDTDGDGEGNNVDEDDDDDGIDDEDDLEPLLAYDPNGDDDMDGFPNSVEDLNGDGNPYNDDSDGDGIGDFLDPYSQFDDDDGDGILNGVENENKDPNPYNNDCDNDGMPDFLDADPCGVSSAGAFTPNGDGMNDTWVIQGIEGYPFNTVKVYNKNGHEVFGARGYKNDWYGGFQNSLDKLPAGSYYYQINLGDGSKPIDGWLFLNY